MKIAKTILEMKIRSSKKDFSWKRIAKMGGRYGGSSEFAISIRRLHAGARRKSAKGELYFSSKMKVLYGNKKYVELFLTDGYLGIKFLDVETIDSYVISQGSKRLDKVHARVLKKITPKHYKEDELEYNKEESMLIVPITLDEKITPEDLDFNFVDSKEISKNKTN